MELRKRYDAEKENVETGVIILTLTNGDEYNITEQIDGILTIAKMGGQSLNVNIHPRTSNSIDLT